jgi:FMN reductase (NADPH)/FMN reductase [NAD(P)H]
MNPVIDVILQRQSVRAYEDREIGAEHRAAILEATLRAPTAGNLMLYSIIEVTDQAAKDILAETCDHQPFIAKAPWVLLFLADYQRWYDYFLLSGVEELCEHRGEALLKPEEADLFLACCDALIAAQTAVLAAESLGIGSCYIGDIMENFETHRELFDLPPYTFPIALLCFGYPSEQQRQRTQTTRFDQRFIVFEDRYHRLDQGQFAEMFRDIQERFNRKKEHPEGIHNPGQLIYSRKFSSDFAVEMRRSVRAMLQAWRTDCSGT